MENMGRLVLVIGISITVMGGLLMLIGRIFPNLPSIRIQVGPLSCFFPIVASIILSIVATIILNVIIRIFR